MLREFLDRILEVSKKANGPVKLESRDPAILRYAVGDGIINIPEAPAPRNHVIATVEELATLANRFAEVDDAHPVVWYSPRGIVLVIDDHGQRANRAKMTLQMSDLFARLQDLRRDKSWFQHKDFLRLLRVDLAGALPQSALYDTIRKVKFENSQIVRSNVIRGKESMGRDIESRTSGEGEIPEFVVLQVPVFKSPGQAHCLFPVSCAVEVDPTRLDGFQLLPLPDELVKTCDSAMVGIGEMLRELLDEKVPCYYGEPDMAAPSS